MTKEAEYSYNLNQIELLEKIGEGAFGIVYKVREKRRGTIYAAKINLRRSS